MKESDLRIGSTYLSVKFNQPVTLTAEDIYELVVRAEGASIESYIKEMFEPIELTKEWLIKAEFKSEIGYLGYKKGNLLIEIWGDSISARLIHDTLHSYYIKEIKFIHELQNLYFAFRKEE